MQTLERNLNKVILFSGFITLITIVSLSDPNLIDGISYSKVAVGIFMTILFAPLLVINLMSKVKSTNLFLIIVVFLFFASIMFKDDNLYQNIFGAPGRSNGLLSLLNFSYFIMFGIFIRKNFKIDSVFKILSVTSFGVSTVSIVLTYLNVGSNSIFASWNLSNPNFHENIDLIAPLISMGLIAEIYLIRSSKSYYRFLILVPILVFLIKLGLLQSIISIALGLIVLVLLELKPRMKSSWVPMALGIGYVGGLWLTSFTILQIDPSVNERRQITFFFKDLIHQLTFFPQHIDALSDFTKEYKSNQILDDLHNVFIQTTFSFGILIGLLFIYISVKPFWIKSIDAKVRSGYLSIYTVFFVSLFVGISSPNFMYFGAVLIGLSLGSNGLIINVNKNFTTITAKLFVAVIIAFMFIPVVVQARDYVIRKEISNITSSIPFLDAKADSDFERLSFLTTTMADPGYRYLVARNFYTVNECIRGDSVLELMVESNPSESRIPRLLALQKNCSNFPFEVD